MSVLSLPSSAGISRMHWELQRNDVGFGEMFMRASDPLWRVGLEFSPDLEANSGYLRALLMRLRGGANQLELHNWQRPAPVGTYRGSLSLASSVAAGATSMSIVAANDNLLTFPEAFDNAAWVKANTSVSANVITAPDGTLTADKLVESTANSGHYIEQYPTIIAGTTNTRSWHIKAAERTLVRLEAFSRPTTSVWAAVTFDLSTGLFSGPQTAGGASQSYSAQSIGDGWYRLLQTLLFGGADTSFYNRVALIGSGSTVYTGTGTSGIYMWGAKLNAGPTATDYGNGKTLKKGDLLGIGSGTTQQVVMVTEDAVSTSQGNITVQFQPPLRNAFSAGQSVVWDKPKALFRRVSNELGWDCRGKNPVCSGMTMDLVEDTRAA